MARTPSTMLELGTPAPEFSLADVVSGATVASGDYAGRPLLVAFICNHCPYVIHIRDQFIEFCREYGERGLAIVAISANDPTSHPDDGPEKMAELARAAGFPMPYLFDREQEVAKEYQAACTPDFFLFDAAHRLVYRGQFDDARPGNGQPVTGRDLRAAAAALLAGRAIEVEQKPSLGCNIKWRSGNEPEYYAA